MHAWVTGIKTHAPSAAVGKYLIHDTSSIRNMEEILEFTDVLVFDFLLDGKILENYYSVVYVVDRS